MESNALRSFDSGRCDSTPSDIFCGSQIRMGKNAANVEWTVHQVKLNRVYRSEESS